MRDLSDCHGGVYYKPLSVKRIQDKHQEAIKEFQPVCLRSDPP